MGRLVLILIRGLGLGRRWAGLVELLLWWPGRGRATVWGTSAGTGTGTWEVVGAGPSGLLDWCLWRLSWGVCCGILTRQLSWRMHGVVTPVRLVMALDGGVGLF